MAKGTTGDAPGTGTKMISTHAVAVIMASVNKFSVTKAELEMLSALDGDRSVSGYEHAFRPIIANAKDLKKRIDDGETFTPVPPGRKKAGEASAANRKRKDPSEDDETAPIKPKKKAKPKPRVKKEETAEDSIDVTPVVANETPLPANETPLPANETPTSANETLAPVKETPIPTEEIPPSVNEATLSVNETAAPAFQMPVSPFNPHFNGQFDNEDNLDEAALEFLKSEQAWENAMFMHA